MFEYCQRVWNLTITVRHALFDFHHWWLFRGWHCERCRQYLVYNLQIRVQSRREFVSHDVNNCDNVFLVSLSCLISPFSFSDLSVVLLHSFPSTPCLFGVPCAARSSDENWERSRNTAGNKKSWIWMYWNVFWQLLPVSQDVNPRFNTIIHSFSFPSSPRERTHEHHMLVSVVPICLLLNLFLGERGSLMDASHKSRPVLMPANADEASLHDTTGQDLEREWIIGHRQLATSTPKTLGRELESRSCRVRSSGRRPSSFAPIMLWRSTWKTLWTVWCLWGAEQRKSECQRQISVEGCSWCQLPICGWMDYNFFEEVRQRRAVEEHTSIRWSSRVPCRHVSRRARQVV